MSRESELDEGRSARVVIETAAPPAPVEEDDDQQEAQRKKWFKEVHAWVTVLATIAASVTYQAGLNPPGGFWQANDSEGHHAGDPVLHDEHWWRYTTFFFLNATAFVTSLVIMVLLLSLQFRYKKSKVAALMLTTFVDLVCLIGAYIAGSTRYLSSIYVLVITIAVFVIIVLFGEVRLWDYFAFIVANLKWCPVPAGVMVNRRRGCSACCASAPRAEG